MQSEQRHMVELELQQVTYPVVLLAPPTFSGSVQ
jgi:hypothetical protein